MPSSTASCNDSTDVSRNVGHALAGFFVCRVRLGVVVLRIRCSHIARGESALQVTKDILGPMTSSRERASRLGDDERHR